VSIKISPTTARQRLEAALGWAESEESLPELWLDLALQAFQMPAKTYVPALGTALLARATDDRIDPLSIKASHGPNTYSLRGLCHEVLVPAARQFGFSIRNTGREPINNQPFFRYDHMTEIDRVRDRASFEQFMSGIKKVEELDQSQALAALAAYLRVAIAAARQLKDYSVDPSGLTLQRVIRIVEEFLEEGIDRPNRTQALVAAAFDVTHADVRSRRLNDPSRDYPGDIQAFDGEAPILAVEVRAKSVLGTEVEGFTSACRQANIERAFMVVIWPGHRPLSARGHREAALELGVLLTIIERVDDLLTYVFGWADVPLSSALKTFTVAALQRLKEIEAHDESLQRWVELTGGTDALPRPT
jgi:hypothetical protein